MSDTAAPVSHRPDHELIVQLLTEALATFESDRTAAKRHIVHARSLIQAPMAITPMVRGRLAGWQLRRVMDFVHGNLSTKLKIEDAARIVRISPSYLSRSFKATVGIAYSDFVVRARLDLAKRLLLTTDVPISEIALGCGLTDQSHLTRLVKRMVGLPPGAWRRLGAGGGEPLGSASSPGDLSCQIEQDNTIQLEALLRLTEREPLQSAEELSRSSLGRA